MSGVSGPITIREKPERHLVNSDAFMLADVASRDDFRAFMDWVKERGGHAPYRDENGVLVASEYPDGNRYYEFIQASSLVVFDAELQEFTIYGATMADRYEVVVEVAR